MILLCTVGLVMMFYCEIEIIIIVILWCSVEVCVVELIGGCGCLYCLPANILRVGLFVL